jgi:hypothetical protein
MKCLCEESVVTRERREKVQGHGSKEREQARVSSRGPVPADRRPEEG